MNRHRIPSLLVIVLLLWCGGMYAWSERPDADAARAVGEQTQKSRRDESTSPPTNQQTPESQSTLRDVCEAFADSAGEPEDVRALMQYSLFWPSLEQMVSRCELSKDMIDALLGELTHRLEEGDRQAAELAYALGGAHCDESPRRIDGRCHDEAQEASLPLAQWRTCVQDGYDAYHDCVWHRLNDAGLNATAIRHRYIYGHSIELSSLIDQMRAKTHADPSVDLEDSLAQLEAIAQDRVFVEGIVRPDIYSAKLFSLSYALGSRGDAQAQERVNKLLLFWGRRSEMIVSLLEYGDLPYNETLVILSP